MRIPLLRVTKGSTDGTVRVGDRVYYAPDGSLCLSAGGFITPDDLTDEILDFESVVDDAREVIFAGGSEIVMNKEISNER